MVWTQTLRLTGRVFFFGGLLAAVLAVLGPLEWFVPVFVGWLPGIALLACGYSYWLFRQAGKIAKP